MDEKRQTSKIPLQEKDLSSDQVVAESGNPERSSELEEANTSPLTEVEVEDSEPEAAESSHLETNEPNAEPASSRKRGALEALTPGILESVLDEADPEERVSLLAQLTYQGPLPPPAMLADFNEIDPTFANRIVTMAENEQKARHGLDSKIVNTERIKLVFALIVSLTLIGGAIYVATLGQALLAAFLGGAGILAGIVRMMIRALLPKKGEDED